jgi:hypothetical protein
LPVRGGFAGRMIARLFAIRKLGRRAVWSFKPIYRMRCLSGIFAPLAPRRMRPRVICFTRLEGPQLRLLIGGRVVGELNQGEAHWSIKPPFRLFIDEASLPSLGTEDNHA